MLFLHGFGSSIIEWDNHVRSCRNTFRCIAPDLPGHGRSSIPAAGDANLQFVVENLAALIKHLRLERPAIVGHSMGGRLAARIALSHPELVRGLVLVNAPLDQPLPPDLKLIARTIPLPLVPWFFRRKKLLRGFMKRYSSEMVRAANEMTERKADFLRQARRRNDFAEAIKFLVRLGRDVLRDDTAQQLARLKCPTLVVWSDRDHTCPISSANLIVDNLAGARLEVLKGCAHNPHLERFEDFIDLLKNYLPGL